jgi:hypothetical protein
MMRIRDVSPGSWFFLHPGSRMQQQKREGKKDCYLPYLFCSHKFYKIINYFIFEQVQKKMGSHRQKN